jgi:hypothetical protein
MTNSFQMKGESVCANSRWAMPDRVRRLGFLRSGHSACLTLAATKSSSICRNRFFLSQCSDSSPSSAIPLRLVRGESSEKKAPRKWRAKSAPWRHGEEVITSYVVPQHYLCLNGCFYTMVESATPTYLTFAAAAKGFRRLICGLRHASRGSDGLCCCFNASWLVHTLPRHEKSKATRARGKRTTRPLSILTRTQSTSTGENS